MALLDHLPAVTGFLGVLLFLGILAGVEGGRRLALRSQRLYADKAAGGLGAVEGAVFALLGLLLAFAFSGATSRFDGRRALIVQEANAIGTAYLRVDLLTADAQRELRPLYKEYVVSRLATYDTSKNVEAIQRQFARNQELQERLWKGSLAGLAGQSPAATSLVIASLNDMIDITTTRWAAAHLHPPAAIYGFLFGLCVLAALLVGYGLREGRRPWLHLVAFAGMMAVTIFLIVDIEFPRRGFIRMDDSDQLLRDVLSQMR